MNSEVNTHQSSMRAFLCFMNDPERLGLAALMIVARCAAVFVAAFVLSAFADWITPKLFGNFSSWMDDALIGAAAMLLYGAYERRDSARREVNHHVRNAMMIILFSKDKEAVEEARKRIDAALRTWL